MNIFKFLRIKKYKVVATYEDIEYSQCEKTGKRRIRFHYSEIDVYGNLVKRYGQNLNRNYLIDYDFLESKIDLPRSPKELRGEKPIPRGGFPRAPTPSKSNPK